MNNEPGSRTAPHEVRPRASTSADLSGTFGRYRIIRKLGQGGMGAVYLAEDPELDRRVALKVPHFAAANDEILARFYREAKAAATIEHPNVCPIFDVGEVKGIHYVTMAYIEGRPLSDLLRDGKPLPQRPSAAVVRKLAVALQEAHAKGVIHRDLKPANIMINRRKEPVVMDFGLARRADKDIQLTQDGALIGTPAYMPPEQVKGDVKAMGPACDIYSLGVILYQMLTGQLPFQGHVMAVLAQVLTEEPRPPSHLRPDLDPPLEAICRKAMTKDPAARYGTMAEFASALTDYLRGDAVPTKTAPPISAEPNRPAAENRSSDDETATELLGRLLERLDATARPATVVEPAPRSRSILVPLIAGACLLLAGCVVAAVLLTGNKHEAKPTTVVVQLQGLADRVTDPSIAILLLDGHEVTREQLAGPIPLTPGEHELVMKRADGTVVGQYRFTVGVEDEGREIAIPAAEPKRPADPEPSPDLVPSKLTAKDIGNIEALESLFRIHEFEYDPAQRREYLNLEAKRDFRYIPAEVRIQVRLYDADDARIYRGPLSFERVKELKRGARAKAHFNWGDSRSASPKVRRMLLDAPGDTEFPVGPRPEIPKFDPASLPAGIAFDFQAAEEVFTILKAGHDSFDGKLTLLLEAKRPIDYVPRDHRLEAHGFDSKGKKLTPAAVSFEHVNDLMKGERVRASFGWAVGATKVVLVRPKR